MLQHPPIFHDLFAELWGAICHWRRRAYFGFLRLNSRLARAGFCHFGAFAALIYGLHFHWWLVLATTAGNQTHHCSRALVLAIITL